MSYVCHLGLHGQCGRASCSCACHGQPIKTVHRGEYMTIGFPYPGAEDIWICDPACPCKQTDPGRADS